MSAFDIFSLDNFKLYDSLNQVLRIVLLYHTNKLINIWMEFISNVQFQTVKTSRNADEHYQRIQILMK